jgi:phosphoglycolate phosphatase
MSPRAIFFDFDGVLVDSVAVKTGAMRRLFAGERPEHVDAIVALHERLGGISRYRKFDLAYETILKRALPPHEREQLGRRFSELALEAVIAAPMIPGAADFIARYHELIPLFVVSGTPETELHLILERRDLSRFFNAARGSPRAKSEILRDLTAQHRIEPLDAVFIGDAITDRDAATSVGIPFLGIVAPGCDNPFGAGISTLPDLSELDAAARLDGGRSDSTRAPG